MSIKRPLVQSSGELAELPAGDRIAPAALGTGTADSTTYLRGDGTWGTPAGGGTTTVTGTTLGLLVAFNSVQVFR